MSANKRSVSKKKGGFFCCGSNRNELDMSNVPQKPLTLEEKEDQALVDLAFNTPSLYETKLLHSINIYAYTDLDRCVRVIGLFQKRDPALFIQEMGRLKETIENNLNFAAFELLYQAIKTENGVNTIVPLHHKVNAHYMQIWRALYNTAVYNVLHFCPKEDPVSHEEFTWVTTDLRQECYRESVLAILPYQSKGADLDLLLYKFVSTHRDSIAYIQELLRLGANPHMEIEPPKDRPIDSNTISSPASMAYQSFYRSPSSQQPPITLAAQGNTPSQQAAAFALHGAQALHTVGCTFEDGARHGFPSSPGTRTLKPSQQQAMLPANPSVEVSGGRGMPRRSVGPGGAPQQRSASRGPARRQQSVLPTFVAGPGQQPQHQPILPLQTDPPPPPPPATLQINLNLISEDAPLNGAITPHHLDLDRNSPFHSHGDNSAARLTPSNRSHPHSPHSSGDNVNSNIAPSSPTTTISINTQADFSQLTTTPPVQGIPRGSVGSSSAPRRSLLASQTLQRGSLSNRSSGPGNKYPTLGRRPTATIHQGNGLPPASVNNNGLTLAQHVEQLAQQREAEREAHRLEQARLDYQRAMADDEHGGAGITQLTQQHSHSNSSSYNHSETDAFNVSRASINHNFNTLNTLHNSNINLNNNITISNNANTQQYSRPASFDQVPLITSCNSAQTNTSQTSYPHTDDQRPIPAQIIERPISTAFFRIFELFEKALKRFQNENSLLGVNDLEKRQDLEIKFQMKIQLLCQILNLFCDPSSRCEDSQELIVETDDLIYSSSRVNNKHTALIHSTFLQEDINMVAARLSLEPLASAPFEETHYWKKCISLVCDKYIAQVKEEQQLQQFQNAQHMMPRF